MLTLETLKKPILGPRLARFLLVTSMALIVSAPVARAATVKVVTTLTDLASLTKEVGGERVEVTALCKGYQDPHYLEPKPSYSRSLREADLLVYLGLELEVAWLPPLLETARNPKLRPGSPGLLEAAAAVERVLETPISSVDRSQGDIHPFGNPHVLLDPRNAIPVAELIANRLSQLDPEDASGYEERLARFRLRMEKLVEEWEREAERLRGLPVVAYHKQWEYLADWLGLEIIGYVENRPGIAPSPRHVDSLIQTMKHQGVGLVMAATFVDQNASQKVAERAGASVVILPAAVGGVEETETYESFLDTIVHRLLAAAKEM